MQGEGDKTIERSSLEKRAARLEFANRLLIHDITNYLNVVEGNAKLLLDQFDAPDATERVRTIKRQTGAAQALLRDISVVIDGVHDDRPLEPVDAGAILGEELGHLRAAYPDTEINADTLRGVEVRANGLLGSVFANLLRNAIQHNDKLTPTVDVSVACSEETVMTTIRDNGPGIPHDVRDHLLDPSARDDHGLGLYIACSLVDRYGGSLSVECDENGTTVTVELPVESRED